MFQKTVLREMCVPEDSTQSCVCVRVSQKTTVTIVCVFQKTVLTIEYVFQKTVLTIKCVFQKTVLKIECAFQKTVITIGCVFQKTVLTKIFASEREDIRSKYNVELRDTYLSRNIISVIKSKRMRWAGHVARM